MGGALLLPWLWLFLLVSVVGIAAAYQVKLPYQVNVSSTQDCAYLGDPIRCPLIDGWNAIETDKASGAVYRWTRGASPLYFSGIGNQPLTVTLHLSGARPNAAPPVVKVEVDGHDYFIQSTTDFADLAVSLPRQQGLDGNLRLFIYPPVFHVTGDSRDLGVRVNTVTVTPADRNLGSIVIPDPGVTGSLLLALLVVWLICYRAFGRVRLALGCVTVSLLTMIVALAWARPAIGWFAPQIAVVGLWALGFATLTLVLVPRSWADARTLGLLAGAVAFAFVLRFGGTVYPQFISIDLNFHAQHIEQMLHFFQGQGGNFYFASELPNGTPVPYPSAYYVLLTPFSWLLGGSNRVDQLLLRFASSLLDTLIVIAVYHFASRFGKRVALYAAALYAIAPAIYELLSAGAHTNIFAQTTFVATMVCLMETLNRPVSGVGRRGWLVGFFVFALLTLLGHYGTALAMLVVIGIVGLVWLLFAPASQRGQAWRVWASLAGAVILSFLVYYVHYLSQMSLQFQNIISGGKLYHSAEFSYGFSLPDLLGDVWRWQGWVIVPLAGLGIIVLLIGRVKLDWADEDAGARLVLFAWSLAAVLLTATGLFDRFTVRYNLMMMPLLCVWAAIGLVWLAQRSRPLAGVTLGLAALYAIISWGGGVLVWYH